MMINRGQCRLTKLHVRLGDVELELAGVVHSENMVHVALANPNLGVDVFLTPNAVTPTAVTVDVFEVDDDQHRSWAAGYWTPALRPLNGQEASLGVTTAVLAAGYFVGL